MKTQIICERNYHIKKPFNFIPSLFNEKNDLIRFNVLKKKFIFFII